MIATFRAHASRGARTIVLLLAIQGVAAAQHPTSHDSMPGMQRAMAGPLRIPMDRNGSGTTWIPDAVPLPAHHGKAGAWDLMLHGFVFAQYDWQDGPRGDEQFGSLNWAMLMASRDAAGGRLQLRTMLSLDPATVTRRGYPLLLQTGETYRGSPLRDRQHPHDFWMELGALYERPLTEHVGVSLYAAPSGEPALGPVAFMHRPSGMDNPFAPLGHHWQDATHISYGVVTAGVFTRSWKLEGSAFNGREPNEKRWDFDRLRIDSYSGRLTYNPDEHWSFATGYGYLASPEALEPDESLHRVTVSALHGTGIGENGWWASAFVFGANRAHGDQTSSGLIESELVLGPNTILARAERVQKNAEELGLTDAPFSFAPNRTFRVSAASLGFVREVIPIRGGTVGLGAMGTVNFVPGDLRDAYGSRTPLGAIVFLRLRPAPSRDAHAAMRN